MTTAIQGYGIVSGVGRGPNALFNYHAGGFVQNRLPGMGAWVTNPHIMQGTNTAYGSVMSGSTGYSGGPVAESDYSFGLDWLTAALDAGAVGCSKVVLVAFIAGLSGLLSRRQFSVVDAILSSLRPEKLSPEVLIAAARTSFAARHKLPSWRPAVNRMQVEFDARGQDSSRLLHGLI